MKNKFENLGVWEKAHQLTLRIYKLTNKFPSEEKFRLGDQLRRSAASVSTNIVEGSSRIHRKEFQQFLNLAKASLEETKYHILLARDLKYVNDLTYLGIQDQCEEVGRMLAGLTRSLKY